MKWLLLAGLVFVTPAYAQIDTSGLPIYHAKSGGTLGCADSGTLMLIKSELGVNRSALTPVAGYLNCGAQSYPVETR